MQTTTITEEDLIRKLKTRDEEAFDYLYKNYSSALYKTIVQIVVYEEEAHDCLQKVFMNIWQKIEGYDTKRGKLYTWMLNIARNAAIDTTRAVAYQQKRKNIPFNYCDVNLINAQQYYLKTDGIGLYRYVSQLKPQHKKLIDMVYYKGYSHPEIAQLEELPLNTVKTRVRTALSQLRGIIGKEYEMV
ncbi:MAG: RNA polymerase sigma factor [Flavitalea sp.]